MEGRGSSGPHSGNPQNQSTTRNDFNKFDKCFGPPGEGGDSVKNVGSHIFCCVVNFIFTAVNFKTSPQALGFLNLFLLLNVIWNTSWPRKIVNWPSILKSSVLI